MLAAKIRFAGAAEPVDSQDVQVIPVYFVGGGKKDPQLFVPDAAASPGDTVKWDPKDGVKRIIRIKFKKPGKNPFDNAVNIFNNPSGGPNAFSKGVLADATVNMTHEYEIKVQLTAGGTATLDPPLDIVPGA